MPNIRSLMKRPLPKILEDAKSAVFQLDRALVLENETNQQEVSFRNQAGVELLIQDLVGYQGLVVEKKILLLLCYLKCWNLWHVG